MRYAIECGAACRTRLYRVKSSIQKRRSAGRTFGCFLSHFNRKLCTSGTNRFYACQSRFGRTNPRWRSEVHALNPTNSFKSDTYARAAATNPLNAGFTDGAQNILLIDDSANKLLVTLEHLLVLPQSRWNSCGLRTRNCCPQLGRPCYAENIRHLSE